MTFVGAGVRRCHDGSPLDVTYFAVSQNTQDVEAINSWLSDASGRSSDGLLLQGLSKEFRAQLEPWLGKSQQQRFCHLDTFVSQITSLQSPVDSVEDAFFRLQLLSRRLVKPHEIGLNGLFSTLQNLAWSQHGPLPLDILESARLQCLWEGSPLVVSHVDKFPYLVNYFVPEGVRIAAGSQVRLGAYLGPGTTVMPAGYVNFNAGTEGQAMVEGRVSAGVFVGEGSDLGGGASIMGTLSGGGTEVVSIGPRCLIGANAGTGISLGTGCTIAAGVYVYGGKPVWLCDSQGQPCNLDGETVGEGNNVFKAKDLSGRDFLLFYEDTRTGRLLCRPNEKLIALNESLHQHN